MAGKGKKKAPQAKPAARIEASSKKGRGKK
jgi:hypothetical protein